MSVLNVLVRSSIRAAPLIFIGSFALMISIDLMCIGSIICKRIEFDVVFDGIVSECI